MADRDPSPEPVDIDRCMAHPSRVYDYLLGGCTNFQVDREAAERGAAALLGGLERGRKMVRDQRRFLRSAVEWLAMDAKVRQFLDVGTGIPNGDNVHGAARLVAPDTRIVYVDNDPIVLAHAAELLVDDDATAYVHEDLRRPGRVLRRAAETLDLREPVGLVLVGVLHLIEDGDDPWGLVSELIDALAIGSYVVISHMASDIEAEMTEAADRANATMRDPFVLRDRAGVERFLCGLDVIEPGLVTVDRWAPDRVREVEGPVTPFYAAVGQKFEGGRVSARSGRRGTASSTAGVGASRAQPKVATTACTAMPRWESVAPPDARSSRLVPPRFLGRHPQAKGLALLARLTAVPRGRVRHRTESVTVPLLRPPCVCCPSAEATPRGPELPPTECARGGQAAAPTA